MVNNKQEYNITPTSNIDYVHEYFIKIAPYMARTFENNNTVMVLAYILSKCSMITHKGRDRQGWAYVTYGDIYTNTRTPRSTAARCITQLVNSGVLEKDTRNNGDRSICYYKPNQKLIDSLRDEDIHVWNLLRNKNIQPTKKNFDKYAKISVEIREKSKGTCSIVEHPYSIVEHPPEEGTHSIVEYPCSIVERPYSIVERPHSTVTPLIYNLINNSKRLLLIDKATINSCTTFPVADAQEEAEHINQVASESIQGEVSLLNPNEDKSNENSLVTSNNNSNPSSPCLINNKDSSEVFPCYLDNNLISAPPTPQNSDSAAKCGPDGEVDVSVEGGELASGSCRIDSNSKFDLVPHSDTKTQNHPQKNNHILNPQNLFKSGKGSKKEETMAELTKLRETDPKFMRIYDAWVEQGFPAHKPNTAVFREAKKVIPQILDGTFFEDKADVDGYSRVYSVREIIKAIKNFKLAFDANYEPSNKNWLKKRKNLAKFFFDPMLHTKSLFIEFLEEPKLIEPATKSPEVKYMEKYRKKYVYMPEWFKPLYDIYAEDGRMIPEEEFTEEQNKWGIAYYFNHFMLDFEEDDEGLAFGELPFGWSDMEILVSLWRERDDVTDEEFENDPNLMGSWEDVFYAIQSKVNEMGSKMTRSHLFSERVWNMVYED
jgi:hypothetical protein